VIKIEPPQGDSLRQWPPHVPIDDDATFSLNFASLNRTKRSLCLDLKTDTGRRRALDLAGEADIIVENYRPGVLDRLGLGFDAVAERNSRVIYCSISGYGATGPRASDGAFDVVVQAESGLMDVTGPADGPAAKCGVPVGDFVAGQYAALAAIGALYQLSEGRSESAVHIDVSMLESLLAISALQTSEYWGNGEPPRRLGTAHPRNAPYQAFTARDRMIVIAAGNDRLWKSVCDVISQPGLADDPRFTTQANRVANMAALEHILNTALSERTAEEWLPMLRERGVPSGLIRTFAEALADPQVAARKFIKDGQLPGGRLTPRNALPFLWNGTNSFQYSAAPRLGEQNHELDVGWPPEPPDRHRLPRLSVRPEERVR
jgi:crotonobetainyl-CoA:carnitine CoA-transferase CaiB-like acyl-CoA transferase